MAEGELLAQVSNYAPADDALETMCKVLSDHPRYAELSAEDPWVYRADWAWSTIQQRKKNDGKRQTSFSAGGKGNSPLGRIGYMGPENPDLSPRGE